MLLYTFLCYKACLVKKLKKKNNKNTSTNQLHKYTTQRLKKYILKHF